MDTLISKLLNSSAVSSLLMEDKVYNKFRNLNWRCVHSPFYTDTDSHKARELDVTARRYWSAKDLDGDSIAVNFLVECKSSKDYNIIVSQNSELKLGQTLLSSWVGHDVSKGYGYDRVVGVLKEHNIDDKSIERIVCALDNECYPNGKFRFSKYEIRPFELPVFNAFRETNTSTTKELDSSVLWKAYQGLKSCVGAHNELAWDSLGMLSFQSTGTLSMSLDDKVDWLERFVISSATHIEYLHPILVIESNLWELSEGELIPLKYFRLAFQTLFEGDDWIDVINVNHLDEYLKKSKEYEDKFKEIGFIENQAYVNA